MNIDRNAIARVFAPLISNIDLLPCPACGFDESEWEDFVPVLYKDHRFQQWVVECQNCGIEFVPQEQAEANAAAEWNALPR